MTRVVGQPGAAVEIHHVTKRYGSATVLDDVSLSVNRGEFVTLLGASGSGKTTLLRIIAGFLQADAGSVVVGGEDLSRIPVDKRRMGMVFQNYALFPHMSVRRNVLYPLKRQGFARSERAQLVADALSAVGLLDFADRMPSSLSGGQQQRVALARAIVAKPRVLLMDEPLGALDRALRESLQIEMRKLSTNLGLTVINVTHDQEEALSISDRVALISAGKVAQFGTPQELYKRPNSPFVAAFVGESTLIEGHLEYRDGRCTLNPTDSVQVGALEVDGTQLPDGDNGGRATLMLRPHVIQITGIDEVSAGVSWVEGVVSARIFTGSTIKYTLNDSAGREYVVRDASHDARMHEVGDKVALTWRAEHAYLIGCAG